MCYWNSEKFLSQVRHALTIAEIKYPALTHDLVFIFNQSSAYSLNANHTAPPAASLKICSLEYRGRGCGERKAFPSKFVL